MDPLLIAGIILVVIVAGGIIWMGKKKKQGGGGDGSQGPINQGSMPGSMDQGGPGQMPK